jgi:hypothetical protein
MPAWTLPFGREYANVILESIPEAMLESFLTGPPIRMC